MAQSLSRLVLHIIFSTKDRQALITPDLARPLHAYLVGTFKGLACPSIQIGGTSDHLHALAVLGRTTTVADLVRDVKVAGTKWIKEQGHEGFAWQGGYGAFSVSQSRIEEVTQYIKNQPDHHRTRSFKDEYRSFLRRHHVEFDEQYVWD